MENIQEPIRQIRDIRNMMERSSRFISLSGLSGVAAGIAALTGWAVSFILPGIDKSIFTAGRMLPPGSLFRSGHPLLLIVLDAIAVLVIAIASAVYFTTRKARKKGLRVWDHTAKRLILHLSIPLLTGGIFCLILIYHGIVFLLAPATLLFYGLSLIHASQVTVDEIRFLGITEVILGLLASLFTAYGTLFWAFGFGVVHIFYGMMMYYREDQKEEGANT